MDKHQNAAAAVTTSTRAAGDSATDLTDSLLHTNFKRIVLGALCGAAAGFVMLLLSTLFTPEGANKLWWLQVMASMVYGGKAATYDVASDVIIIGAVIHFALSVLCGTIVGKMTTNYSAARMTAYGLVLGGLCWLATNMFGPDFIDIYALFAIPQWTRMFLYVSFGIMTGVFLSLSSRALKA